jgi:chorismate mutase
LNALPRVRRASASTRLSWKGTTMAEDSGALAQIEQHRQKIDAIDEQIVTLLNERALQSLQIRDLKPEVHMGLYDPRREEEILEKVSAYNKGPLFNDNLRDIYTTILKVMKEAPSL